MNIEVRHDPLSLPSKALLKVRNPKLVENRLDGWIATKHPNFRIRYIVDKLNGTVELGARLRVYMDEAIREVKKTGCYVRKEPWFSKMTAMQRARGIDTSFDVNLT